MTPLMILILIPDNLRLDRITIEIIEKEKNDCWMMRVDRFDVFLLIT